MARQQCEMRVENRYGGREDRRTVHVDTADVPALEETLEQWLSAKNKPRNRWDEFIATFYGEGRPVTVRGNP
jgi:hypothetical protein